MEEKGRKKKLPTITPVRGLSTMRNWPDNSDPEWCSGWHA